MLSRSSLMPEPTYRYDLRASRFRDAVSGRFVSEDRIRGAVDVMIDASGKRLQTLTAALQTGSTSLAEWQDAFRAELKNLHVSVATIAHGGTAVMDQATHGWTGQRLREQYGFLNQWAADVASGAASLDARTMANRAELYALNATGTYENLKMRDVRNSGAALEVRNVFGEAKHCDGCTAAHALGWTTPERMSAVGSRDCKSRDRCHLEFRPARQTEAA